MTLLYIDSFDHYASADLGAKGWANITNATITATGRLSSPGYLRLPNNGSTIDRTITATSGIVVGFGLSISSGTAQPICSLQSGTTAQVELRVSATRALTVTRNGTLLATSTTILSTGVWYYVELKISISDTAGVVAMQINGASETLTFVTGNATNQDTRNGTPTTVDTVKFQGAGAQIITIDDLYVIDTTTGSAPANDFLGDCRVEAMLPSTAGNYAQWTPLSSTNVSNVDESSPDGDTSYNSSSTANQIDSFNYTNITPSSATIYGIQYALSARKDDAGTRTIAPLSRQSSTDYASATTHNLSTSYAYYVQVKEQNPATSAAWTVSDVNSNSEFGYKEIA